MALSQEVERKEVQANWKAEVEVPVFNVKDVGKHNTKADLWMVLYGKVYNVTEYARDHPGGVDALVEVAGQDATSAFEDVGHSEDAREMMHAYLVGSLEGVPQEQPKMSEAPAPAGIAPPSTVSVVRHSPSRHPAKPANRALKPTVELSAFALGTAGFVWLARHHDMGPRSGLLSFMHGSGGSSFTQGFLLASVASTVVAFASFRYLAGLATSHVDFTSYPAHVRSTHVVVSAGHAAGAIAPQEYRKFPLSSKNELSPGIWRFVFALPTSTSLLGLPIGQHVAVRGEVDDHTVTRSYTPVSNNRDLGRLELIIRIYPDGQLGKYLSKLNVGDQVDIRGPKGAMRYRKGMSKHLGMVGGGTGITPLFQLIRAICEDKTDDTTISLIYANRAEQDIMLRKQLDNFAKTASDKLKVYYVLDHPTENWTGGKGYVTKELLAEKMPQPSDDTKILLCGPPPMVNAIKKNLGALGFKEPGAVSKMSDQIFCF